MCPVAAFERMKRLVAIPPNGPAFGVRVGSRVVPLVYADVQNSLRVLISQIGKNPLAYSSHSFRRGGATWAFQCHVPGELVQLQGDWSSDAYKRYVHVSLETKLSVATRMTNSIHAALTT